MLPIQLALKAAPDRRPQQLLLLQKLLHQLHLVLGERRHLVGVDQLRGPVVQLPDELDGGAVRLPGDHPVLLEGKIQHFRPITIEWIKYFQELRMFLNSFSLKQTH